MHVEYLHSEMRFRIIRFGGYRHIEENRRFIEISSEQLQESKSN